MTEQTKSQPAAEPEEGAEENAGSTSLFKQLMVGIATQSWLASLVIHMTIFIVLALVLGTIHVAQTVMDAPSFQAVDETLSLEPEITHFEVGETPLEPTELTTESLTLTEAPVESVESQFNDNSAVFTEAGGGAVGEAAFGGLTSFSVSASGLGPMVKGKGAVDIGGGLGKNTGKGGEGMGFGTRGTGMREAMLGNGGTKQSERAVAAALNWLARHQNPDGSWSLDHTPRCRNGVCSGPGDHKSDAGATALGLLPFFAAGQTHQSKGPYQKNIMGGVNWLIRNQKPSGDLSGGGGAMYSHGLATIALCEAYGMTQDSRIGLAAQGAINFIESGQNKEGSWRYTHGSQDSDTSVFGWQVMALKSGQMAGLKVNPNSLESSRGFLKLVASGNYKERYGYIPKAGGTPAMTSVGLLTSQYLGASRDDPAVRGGVEYLMKNQPGAGARNIYYWYYATQAMHNVQGPEWDKWNRTMRRLLIETQDKSNCAAGSWNPDRPDPDAWGGPGGRLMVTSLSCLTLEVYYRYLPLYKLDKKTNDLDKLE